MNKSEQLFEEAKKYIPGGVNSPVRAFGSVLIAPKFIKSGKDARIIDVDGNEYLDFVGSWGPMITGHANERILNAVSKTMKNGLSFGAATELEVILAKLICDIVKPIDMVRMVNSGTEAVMSALRLARGYTKKEKVIKFAGCYHGHSDSMLVKAGSGLLTGGNPDSLGVCTGVSNDTLIAKYNDIDSVSELFENNKDNVACVIIEPIAANMGVVLPKDGFLAKIRELCTKHNALLIFDEVITGFRISLGGASEYFDITPDLITFGKIIGGGLPVGAYGGKKEIMSLVAPLGEVYQAGTLSGNPIAMAAGIEGLTILKENKHFYDNINDLGTQLADGFRNAGFKNVNQIGSLVCPFFTDTPVVDYETAKTSDTDKFANYFSHMIENKIYIAPSQFEAMFISNCHTEKDIEKTIDVAKKFKI